MKEILARFIVGGLFVSAFAMLGDLLRPKSFAGLLGAAPSVSLATLTLTAFTEGNGYAGIEARSMIFGALAFISYEIVVSQLLIRRRYEVLPVAGLTMVVWFAVALGLWCVMARIAG